MSRPTQMDRLIALTVHDARYHGKPWREIATEIGVHVSTLYEWLRRGRAGEMPYSELVDPGLAGGSSTALVLT